MNFDNIRFTLKYWKLKNYLTQELGYEKERAARTIAELRRMQPNILRMFLTWFRTDELPADTVNGVCVQDIIEHNGMNPAAAFLSLNWVQTDPAAAKRALTRTTDDLDITPNDEELLRQIAKKRGWKLAEEQPEDSSDIIEPS